MALKNRAHFHPGQFAPEKGLRALEDAILKALGSGEYKFAAVSDVVDCFGHIDVQSLPEVLGLPARVIECNVGFEHLNVDPQQERRVRKEEEKYIYVNLDEDEMEAIQRRNVTHGSRSIIYTMHGRCGIPRGSSSSPIIAEYVIAQCLPPSSEGVLIFTWVDDILILAKSRVDVERAYNALRASFGAAPVGSLIPRRPAIKRVADGFEYVGSKFRRRKGKITIEPSEKNWREFKAAMKEHLRKIQDTGQGADEARRYLKGWLGAFSRWRMAETCRKAYLSHIENAEGLFRLYYKGKNAAQKRNADRILRRLGRGYRRKRSRPTGGVISRGSYEVKIPRWYAVSPPPWEYQRTGPAADG